MRGPRWEILVWQSSALEIGRTPRGVTASRRSGDPGAETSHETGPTSVTSQRDGEGDPGQPLEGGGSSGHDGPDSEDLFEQAMEGVQPLDGPPSVPRQKTPSRKAGKPTAGKVKFTVERWGPRGSEQVEGRASGVSRRTLRRLRRGYFPLEQRLDLHGMGQAEGRRAVAEALTRAWERGRRCLLVVHGRGLHSEGEPVLKSSLPEWLAEAPHGPRVQAFVTAPRKLGGAGATLVLLRRQRRRKDPR